MAAVQRIIFFPTSWESSISLVVSALASFIAVAYGLYAKIGKDVLGRMILAVNISDLIFCLTTLSVHVYEADTDFYCKTIQALAHCSLLYSLLWGTFFGHVFYSLIKYQTDLVLENSYKCYVVLSSICAIGLGVATIFTDYSVYDSQVGECVHLVHPDTPDVTLIFFSQIPIAFVTVMGIAWYFGGAYLLARDGSHLKIKNPGTLLIYPGIVIICWLPVNIVNTAVCFGYIPSQFVDSFIKNLYGLQGFFDAIVYSITPILRKCNQSRRREAEEEQLSESLIIDRKTASLKLIEARIYFSESEVKQSKTI